MGLPPWMAGYICPKQQVVLGYMVPVAEVTIHISSNTKLLFIDIVGNSDLTLHVNYKYASISETMNGCIFTATLAPPSLLLSLLKICEEYFDKQCRPKRDAAIISIYYLY